MITFKCKMCGGELEFEQGATVAECPFCGVKQTLPKLDDDRRANLYDRANHFRRQNEYDKAMALYEKILQDDRSDAESYWSLVLCRYGIEYVVDPASGKRVPTVNRVQYTSVLADEDYKSALQYADSIQRDVYRQEAATIDEIQKGILAISSKEEPFDVFICYKETDAAGRRTPDSVLANDLYHQLTREGFKVFFARITLEDKIGSAYEPYIFAALNSAKVMVVLGTKPEYFKAVWVRNEWSRFLALIKSGAEKTLVPAYRDMDPYDLPAEFSHLQAQDMSKLGFMQDLIRGIKKLTHHDEQAKIIQHVPQQAIAQGGVTVESLMKRAYLFLEDKDFGSANEYLDKVLDINPEFASAYIGKLLVELQLQFESDLETTYHTFDNNPNWKKALRFASPEQSVIYNDYAEVQHKHSIYMDGCKEYDKAKYAEALEFFERIPDYLDTKQKIEKCQLKIKQIQLQNSLKAFDVAVGVMNRASKPAEYIVAAEHFEKLQGFKDSAQKAVECRNKAKQIIYDRILEKMNTADTPEAFERVAAEFEKMESFADSNNKAEECYYKAKQIVYDGILSQMGAADTSEAFERVAAEFEKMNEFEDSASKAEECHYKANQIVYNGILSQMGAADTSEAFERVAVEFEKMSSFQDSKEKAEYCRQKADALRNKAYSNAVDTLRNTQNPIECDRVAAVFKYYSGLRDAEKYAAEALKKAEELRKKQKEEAEERQRQEKIKAAAARKRNVRIGIAALALIAVLICALVFVYVIRPSNIYKAADSAYQTGDYQKAAAEFASLKDYKDASKRSKEAYYNLGLVALENGDSDEAMYRFAQADDYEDARERRIEMFYAKGMEFMEQGDSVRATQYLTKALGHPELHKLMQSRTMDYAPLAASRIDCGFSDCIAVKHNGTVVYSGYEDYDLSDWTNIVSVAAGREHVVGLKADGTVVADGENDENQCEVSEWTDIVDIEANSITAGLKSDGTVVTTDAHFDVSNWKNIIDIAVCFSRVYGLMPNGTIVEATSYSNEALDDHDGIAKAISAGRFDELFVLYSDGTVNGYNTDCDVSNWSNIVAIASGDCLVAGLKADGTVVAMNYKENSMCNVSQWKDIVAIKSGHDTLVGIKADGTAVFIGGYGLSDTRNLRLWSLLADTV